MCVCVDVVESEIGGSCFAGGGGVGGGVGGGGGGGGCGGGDHSPRSGDGLVT